jgi:hypothetical protein
VSCSVCHQIGKERLGTPESFNGGFIVAPPSAPDERPEYGPFEVAAGHRRIMNSSSEGYRPTQSEHIRQSELCATCHTLLTKALGPDGSVIGRLPEQVPYQEWLHSEFRNTQSCQACHMPVIKEKVAITRVFGVPREGVSRHTFVAANFFMQRMLNKYRDDLAVAALPQELTAAADATIRFPRCADRAHRRRRRARRIGAVARRGHGRESRRPQSCRRRIRRDGPGCTWWSAMAAGGRCSSPVRRIWMARFKETTTMRMP